MWFSKRKEVRLPIGNRTSVCAGFALVSGAFSHSAAQKRFGGFRFDSPKRLNCYSNFPQMIRVSGGTPDKNSTAETGGRQTGDSHGTF